MLRSLVLAASFLAAVAAVAAEPGLEIETVTAIFQDRAGFLWVGSRAGLVRYDGYSSTLFEHDPADPASLADNAIRTIFEDRHGFLWIGTNTAGLDRLDRTTGTFAHYRPCPSPNAQSLSVYAVVEDRDGTLWVGAQGGLCRFDPRTGAFTRFPAGPDGPGGDYVTALRLDRDGALWIATHGGGLSRRDPVSGRFTTFRFDAGDPSSIASDSVFGIAEEANGALWVATAAGPCRTSPRGGFERFPLGGEAPPVLTTGVAVDGDGDVWASTFGSGLQRLEAGASAFEPSPLRPGIPGGPTDRIAALLADRNGIVWAGTWGGGLARVSPGWRRIETLVTPEPDVDVTAILEDRRGRLWVGRGVRSLLLFEPGREPRSFAVPNAPLSLRDDPSGDLWIGSTAGLHHLDVARGSVELVPGLAPGWVWATWIDRRGRLWVGTGGGGLHRRREDGTFDRFVHDPRDPHSLSENYVTAIVEDAGGTLWVGTRARGLNAFDEAAGSFARYLPDPADDRSLSHASVTALLAARDGSLWVGTGGTGINRVEREGAAGRAAFVRFSEADGLIDDNVVSLAEDSDGTIWIGTRRGLGRFDPKSATFASYGVDDGLPSAELHVGAASSGRSHMYFGTHRGAVVVERGKPFPARRPSPTVLVSIRTPSGHVEGRGAAWDASGIEVPFGQWISMELATLDYGDRRRHRYAYRLEPIHQDWVDLGARRDLTFTALDPGKLTLRVRGRNEQGVWSEMGHPLSIRVIPRFWMTLWFRLLVASAIAGLAITVHLVRTARLERWNRELMRVKEQRERALEQAQASEQSLGQAYTQLRELTGRLEAAKEEERKWLARELHDEMGTGLTTTKLILQLLAGAPSAEDREQRTGEAIGLLDRMIGHVRALSLDLRPPLLDELGLAAALRGYVETLARRAEVEIALEMDGLPHRLAEGVRITAFRIVQEALTNVIRHSGARHVEVRVRYDPGWLDIRVADDGKGFDPAGELELFPGRGHTGLLGMKERVESMQGEFEIRAAVGSGTAIHARLPATVEEGDDERADRR